MATNANLQYSRREKQDEFYTQYSTIEEELWFYKEHFKNKTIYCNCDNPKFSQFWAFFYNNFNKLKLKTLYSTYLSDSPLLYIYDGKSVTVQKINGNGGYDSKECLKILDKVHQSFHQDGPENRGSMDSLCCRFLQLASYFSVLVRIHHVLGKSTTALCYILEHPERESGCLENTKVQAQDNLIEKSENRFQNF